MENRMDITKSKQKYLFIDSTVDKQQTYVTSMEVWKNGSVEAGI
jgi:hypothetical protein